MESLNSFDWATAPPMALLAVTLIAVMIFMYRMMGITKDMQANALRTGTDAVAKALDSFRETQAESRDFYVKKLEDMRSGQSLVEGRVRDLEDQVQALRERNEDLERENKRKDQRITELEEEVAVLRKRLDDEKSKSKTRPARATRGAAGRAAADK